MSPIASPPNYRSVTQWLGIYPTGWKILCIGVLCLLPRLSPAAEMCPAVSCDCQSLPQEDWKKECLRAESELKRSCVSNHNEPKGFCALHGPSAKPLPLATQLGELVLETHKAAIAPLEQQLATAQWSLQDDLASLRRQLDEGNLTNAAQIARLFDTHADAAFTLQRRILGSYQASGDANQAEATAAAYVRGLNPVLRDSLALGESLWKSAVNSQEERSKTRQALAQRLLRTAGKLYEHQAFTYVAIVDTSSAAKTWQEAARLAEHQAQLEAAGGNKPEYITFYSLQASARWNRASFYWAFAKNSGKAQDAWRQAEALEQRFTAAD